jgi:hypothetical protein
MLAIVPGWDAIFCKCHCVQCHARFPFLVDPLSVRANRNAAVVLTRHHGLGAGVLANVHALELAHACTRHAPTHTHAFARGEKNPIYLSFPTTELSSPAFCRGEPRRRPPWCLFARWHERQVILEPTHTFSCTRDPLPAPVTPATPPGLAPPRTGAQCRHPASASRARGHRPCTRRTPEFFLVHMLALVLTHAYGRRGPPSLAIANSTFAAAPAMVSTPPRRLFPLQGRTFLALVNR